jgi:hypothetical protein
LNHIDLATPFLKRVIPSEARNLAI